MSFPQNAYPNEKNFQEVSFPQEVIPPDVDTDVDTRCVRYNPAWSIVLMAAVDQLTQLSAWKGTAEEKKLAVNRATNLKIQLQEFEDCDMRCCYDVVEHRVTGDGALEISINGGEWQPDPNDPRVTAVSLPPLVFDEHHTKCDAAVNVAEHLNEVIDQTSDQLGGTGSILEIASVIALAVFALFLAPESIPVLVPLILPLVSAILFLGQAAFDAYFDTTVHDQILCDIFCSIGDDGTFSQAQYDALIGLLTGDLPASPAKDYFVQIVGRVGLVGINDYAAIGTSADADCSDCSCACGDLTFHVHQGTLVGQSVDEDGFCVIELESEYTGSHHDIAIYWNETDAPVLTENGEVLNIVASKVIGGGGDSIQAFYWRPDTNTLGTSSEAGLDCGTGHLYESNLTGEGAGFTMTLTVKRSTADCS